MQHNKVDREADTSLITQPRSLIPWFVVAFFAFVLFEIAGTWHAQPALAAPVPPLADMVITPTLGSPLGDGTVRATVRWRNQGPDPAAAFTVTMQVPAGFEPTGIFEQNTECGYRSRIITCVGGPVNVGFGGLTDLFLRPVNAGGGTLVVSIVGSEVDPVAANNRASLQLRPGAGGIKAVLPMVVGANVDPDNLPDLEVLRIVPQAANVSVVIRNIGPTAVTKEFWVDLSIGREMRRVNDTWNVGGGGAGAAWLVSAIAAGETLTLTVGDARYQADASNVPTSIPAGTILWAQVDSADTQNLNNTGAVIETHEARNGPYDTSRAAVNNIASTATENVVNFP